MQTTRLSPKIVEQLGYYVYLYIDPRDDTVFYVGKGKGNRALAHLGDKSEFPVSQHVRKLLRLCPKNG